LICIIYKVVVRTSQKTYFPSILLPIALRPFSWTLAFFIIDAHSSLSNAFVLHHFTPSFLKSSSTSFIHLSLRRPLPLRPSNFPLKVFFTDLVSFILTTCLSHSNLRIFITFTISGALYLVINSSFVLILHCQFSFLGPYIFLNIFLSHVINIFPFHLSQSMSLLRMSRLVL